MMNLHLPDVLTRPIRVSFDVTPRRAYTGPREADESPQVTAFLDAVVERLSPLPDETRAEVRAELSAHLAASIAAHEELGGDHEAAVAAAIRQLGEPRTIARRFCRAWDTTTLETPWPAMREALRLFWLAAFIYIAGQLFVPSVLGPFVRSHFGYEPFNFLFFSWFSGALVVLPILTGARVGWVFPRRGAVGTFFALVLSAIATWPLSAICLKYYMANCIVLERSPLLLHCIGIFVCLALGLLIWLPLGTVAAIASGYVKRRKHRRTNDGSRFA